MATIENLGHNGVYVGASMRSVEILGMLGGSYVITDDREGSRWVTTDADLRGYLLSAGLSAVRVEQVIKGLKDPPRKIVLTV